MEVKIRRAKEEDREALVAMLREFHESSPYKDMPFRERDAGEWVGLMLGEIGIVQVAEEDGKPVGMIMGLLAPYPGNRERLIASETALYVQGSRRGSGIGARLSKKFEQVAKQRGASFVMLSALGNNLDAPTKMYAKQGYSLIEAHFAKVVD